MSRSPRPVIYAALAANVAIAVTKLVAAALSGSAAMLAEGVHSLVDMGNQGLLLYGLRRSRRRPDEQFPFGYGKELYFWSFVVAIEVFTLGAGAAIVRGTLQLLHPAATGHVALNYAVLGVSMLFEGGSWMFAVTEFSKTKGKWSYIEAVKRGKDPSRFMVLFEDSAALLGLVIAAAGIGAAQLTGDQRYDGGASILIGLVLGVTAVWLAYETKGLLIGEAANREVVVDIANIARGVPGIERLGEVLTMHVGAPFVLVALTFALRKDAPRKETIDELEAKIKQAHPQVKRLFVRVKDHDQLDQLND